MAGINASVGIADGKQCYNVPADQVVVQQLLSRIPDSSGGAAGKTDWDDPQGKFCAPDLHQAILQFQQANRSRLAYAPDGHVDPGGSTIQLMNRLASSAPQGSPGGQEGLTDSCKPKRRLFVTPFVLQPPMLLRYSSGLTVSTKVTAGPDPLVPYRLWQHAPRIVNYQRTLNLLMDGGPFFPKWRDRNGNPWTPINENGVLDPDTQEAVRYYQMLWGLEPSGELCMVTRILLNPYLRLRGQLQLHYPPLRFRGRGAVGGGSVPSPSTSQGQLGFRAVPQIDAAHIKWNNKLVWSGELEYLRPGDSTPPLLRDRFTPRPEPRREPDKTLKFDLKLPTPAALGKGILTLTCERDGKDELPTPDATCTLELKEEDFWIFDKFSFSPSLDASAQDERGRLSGSVNAGLGFKFQPWKGVDLEAGGKVGVGWDQTANIPVGGNGTVTFSINLPF